MSLTEGVIKYEGAGETRPRVRLQGNMGSIPQETSEFDDVRPEDSASQVGGQYLGTMSTVGTTKKSLPPPPPPPMSGSPKIARSRPGVPPQSSATSAPMQPPPAPKLPAKFSQYPPQGEIASSSTRPDVMRPKTPPKRPPIKTPPVKSVPKKAKAIRADRDQRFCWEEFSHEHLHQREQWKRWLGTMLQPEVQHL